MGQIVCVYVNNSLCQDPIHTRHSTSVRAGAGLCSFVQTYAAQYNYTCSSVLLSVAMCISAKPCVALYSHEHWRAVYSNGGVSPMLFYGSSYCDVLSSIATFTLIYGRTCEVERV